MDQLLDKVGLAHFKEKTNILYFEQAGATKPFETHSNNVIQKRRGTTEQDDAPKLTGLLSNDGDGKLDKRNVDSTKISSDQHLKLLQKINGDKQMRKKREEQRRQKTLDKYAQQNEETRKIDAQVKEILAEEKLVRHKATLDKIVKHGNERKAQIAEAEKAYKEINKAKPLYLKAQEKYEQETES